MHSVMSRSLAHQRRLAWTAVALHASALAALVASVGPTWFTATYFAVSLGSSAPLTTIAGGLTQQVTAQGCLAYDDFSGACASPVLPPTTQSYAAWAAALACADAAARQAAVRLRLRVGCAPPHTPPDPAPAAKPHRAHRHRSR